MNSCCHQTQLKPDIALQKAQCPQKKLSLSNNLIQEKLLVTDNLAPERFLSASYFIAMLVVLVFYPSLLLSARVSGESTVLFSSGCLGLAALIFSLVSFLYYSEADTTLKKWFAIVRNLVLSLSPLIFWWAFHLKTAHSISAPVNSFEWAVAFGLCSSLLLLFMGFVLSFSQKQLLTCYLFLSAALSIYSGILTYATTLQSVAEALLISGLLSLLGFILQTQTQSSNKCQHVEVLLLLSVMLQFGAVLLL